MLAIISPAKTLDFNTPVVQNTTLPQFMDEALTLSKVLKDMSPTEISRIMDISPKLAELNANRFESWGIKKHKKEGKPAVLAYMGDVYKGLNARKLNQDELDFAQSHLRIISGLYGVLKPLDLILPYRLDLGTAITFGSNNDLYEFWKESITKNIADSLHQFKNNILINLASEEYFKTLDLNTLNARIITPVFKDYKNGQYKIISFFAKKARGLMARFFIKNRPEEPEQLKLFNEEGYFYSDEFSKGDTWVFLRG